MDKVAVTLKIFFEDPFWVGVVERIEAGKLSACKVMFGAEPKDYEAEQFFQQNYYRLRFSPAVRAVVKEVHTNPKRIQREVHRQLQDTGMGTRSQQALKLLQEEKKTIRRELKRDEKDAEKQRRFELKQQKKKEKHRGR